MSRAAVLALALVLLAPRPAWPERADREKPVRIEADRMSADDVRRVTVFEGNVSFHKGTLTVRADHVVVRQDAEGLQRATATGKPARFRQRTDPKEGEAAVWIEGSALRIEFDNRDEKVELIDQAHVCRGQDEVRGDTISYDQRTEFLSVRGGTEGGQKGRVQMVIQPKAAAVPPAPATATVAPSAPPASAVPAATPCPPQ